MLIHVAHFVYQQEKRWAIVEGSHLALLEHRYQTIADLLADKAEHIQDLIGYACAP